MDKTKTVTGTPVASVTDISVGRQIRKEKAATENPDGETCELAPMEAHGPEVVALQDEDHLVKVCDGDQIYLYVVSRPKGRKTFKITEIYPGLAKPDTDLRTEIKEPIDLEMTGRFKNLKECFEQIEGIVFEDFEDEPEGGEKSN
jgi:hypothetical protein